MGILHNTLKAIKRLARGRKRGSIHAENTKWPMSAPMCVYSPPPPLSLSLDPNSTYGLKTTRQYYMHRPNGARGPFISYPFRYPTAIHTLDGIISCRIVGETREICVVFDAIPIRYIQTIYIIHTLLSID